MAFKLFPDSRDPPAHRQFFRTDDFQIGHTLNVHAIMGAGCSSDCSKVQPYSTLSRPDEVDDGRKAYEAAQKAANRKKVG